MTVNHLSEDLDYIIRNAADTFQDLKGAKLFITGGTGFIGIWFLESIAWANQHLDCNISVTVLCRNPLGIKKKSPHLSSNPLMKFVRGDVRTFEFPNEKFTHVIHAATSASAKLNTESPLEMIDVIVDGVRRVLDFTVQCGATTLLQLSSCAVYGTQPPDLNNVDEDFKGAPDVTDPWSAYGEAKRISELLGVIYTKNNYFQHKIARISSVVGPYMPLDIHFAIGNFIKNALDNEDIVIKGDGTPLRANLYIADAIVWLFVIISRGQSNRPYNVGSDQGVSLKEIAEKVLEVSGVNKKVIVQQPAKSKTLPSRYVASTKRCQEELGLEQLVDLGSSIKKTLVWNRAIFG
jgi:dTDP-glucose 4,6-dehydratase